MAMINPDGSGDDPIETAAAEWLAKRERGLTAAEQDIYLEWLRQDLRHGQAMARLDRTWRALDILGERHALRGAQPNPDLFAPRRSRRPYIGAITAALAVAAAVVIGVWVRTPSPPANAAAAAHGQVRVIAPPERIVLDDGSVVELNGGTVEPEFTAGERRIRLRRGEAHFVVAKNPARPFIVDTGRVTVRAVGTAFDVVSTAHAVEVLVDEGRVQVWRTDPTVSAAAGAPAAVSAGERAYVDMASNDAAPRVTAISTVELERALAWQSVRLDFSETPLADAVAQFNRRNSRQLVCGDRETANVLIGGTFRADNVDAFVRLLEESFGVTAERRADGSVVLSMNK